jgi:hypothetical protein
MFENQFQSPAIVLFCGITLAVLLIGVIILVSVRSVSRLLKNAQLVLISKEGLQNLSYETKQTLMQIYSQEQLDYNGSLYLEKARFRKLAAGQQVELNAVLEKEAELGNEEFEHYVEQIRSSTAELDTFRNSNANQVSLTTAIEN